jgi:hypothetical protein
MLKERLVKYRYILLATCVSLVFAFYYSHVFKVDFAEQTQAFQSKFTEQEQQLSTFLATNKQKLEKEKSFNPSHFFNESTGFNLHIYRNDSLLFWNTNKLPIRQFADIHYPAEGLSLIHI